MRHGFTEAEWTEYAEGTATTNLADRIEAHLCGCLSCWEQYDQLAQATAALRAAGAEVRFWQTRTDRELRESYRAVLARIQAAEAQEHRRLHVQVQQRLDALTALLAPMCGVQTARNALRAAAQGSPARSLEQVTADNWTPFLTHLTSIATVMCGETGARLVWDRGQF